VRETFGSTKEEVVGTGENYVMRSVIVFISHEILVHDIKED